VSVLYPFLLLLAAVADMIGFADLRSLAMVAVGAVGACLVLAGGYLFLAHRGALRWLALAVVVLAPVTVLVIFTLHGLLWEALVAVALIALAAGAGRRALAPAARNPAMSAQQVPPPKPRPRTRIPGRPGATAPIRRPLQCRYVHCPTGPADTPGARRNAGSSPAPT